MATRETHHSDLGQWLSREHSTRLANLRERIKDLLREMKAPAEDEAQQDAPGAPTDKWADHLEALAEQLESALGAASSPVRREAATDAEDENAGTPAPAATHAYADHYLFGVTLDQIDEFDRLIRTVAAHGDVVASSDTAELATYTLPVLGQAIWDDAQAVRDLLDQIEAQRLERASDTRRGVRETRGVYAVGLVAPTRHGLSSRAASPSLYRLRQAPAESYGVPVH